ncbi:UDP-N-acetylmuramoyl-tripeptide--D-alanyl-D-alanine ligase [uncultured Desulfovibrio sp.]|uniref:UDP-N-acetylmuramoyl-tripeptide--D-alanyl-D- alanine ligase n=1 Tax=uncultured Desulfovibrio sp. TaxID=167968 RepID=UPI0026037BE8|nr:UDP-N-acetylmuramoyl-tripeptide--D-alanyl-D-alanine ligase [uncultured Desulfovibrio sp.]
MRLTFNEIAEHLGLPERADGLALNCAVTDSREAAPGALFVCIPGSRVDGHDYARAAAERGASALLASRALPEAGIPVLRVDDTVRALGKIAALWRGRTKARVVGVTGTAGKTTVKEVLAQTLAVRGKTARSPLNNNNQIGMPRAMLATDGDEDFWVMEAGISHAGDMEELASVLRPDVGLILNVGAGHTEGLGGRGVAWHKTRMLQHLSAGGAGLVCADYPDLLREARAAGVALHCFSALNGDAEYQAAYVGPADGDDGRGVYRLRIAGHRCEVTAPFRGHYGAENVAAVAACAHLLGLTAEETARGLAQASLPQQRFREIRAGAWLCIDDTYNANPLSMRRMLDAAAERAKARPFVAVLGEMLELGDLAAAEHEALGRHLAALRPAAVFWKGGQGAAVRIGLNAGGYAGPWLPVEDAAAFVGAWEDVAAGLPGGVALFKGSRGNRLECLLEALRGALDSVPDAGTAAACPAC